MPDAATRQSISGMIGSPIGRMPAGRQRLLWRTARGFLLASSLLFTIILLDTYATGEDQRGWEGFMPALLIASAMTYGLARVLGAILLRWTINRARRRR